MCDFLTLKMLPLACAMIKTKNRCPFDPLVKNSLILSKDVVLAVQYKVYLVKQVISLVDTVQYS